LGELRNHFKEALGNGYLDQATDDKFSKDMNEVGFLLSRMMKNVRRARDSHEDEKKAKHASRRSPASNPIRSD